MGSIINHPDWHLSEKGKKDRQRHNSKVDDAIRKSVKDVIAEESIITKKNDRTIRIPVKGIKEWRFKYGKGKTGGAGAGQGKGKPGDVIYRKQQGESGQPGNEKGEDVIEVDVDLNYLIQIMFEELGLPYLEEKNKITKYIPSGFKFDSIFKKGIFPQLHKKRTVVEAIRRHAGDIREITDATGCEYDDGCRAYIQSDYEIKKAIDIILSGQLDSNIDPNVAAPIEDDDLRFKQIDENMIPQSNAVVIFMMDVSGSMDRDKKYLARGLLFWFYQFIKTQYENVEVRFISHTTEAKLVDEDEFFHKMESGGTSCHTAFDLCTQLLESEYPADTWNRYTVYISDGEDFNIEKTVISVNTLIDKYVNMLSYCEIHPDNQRNYGYQMDELLDALIKHIPLKQSKSDLPKFYKNEDKRVFAGIMTNKDHIWPFLKSILFGKKK